MTFKRLHQENIPRNCLSQYRTCVCYGRNITNLCVFPQCMNLLNNHKFPIFCDRYDSVGSWNLPALVAWLREMQIFFKSLLLILTFISHPLESTWYLYLYTSIHTCGWQKEYKFERLPKRSRGSRRDLRVYIDKLMYQTSAGRQLLDSDLIVLWDSSMGK